MDQWRKRGKLRGFMFHKQQETSVRLYGYQILKNGPLAPWNYLVITQSLRRSSIQVYFTRLIDVIQWSTNFF